MANPLRVGIIGTGSICYHGHLPAYAALDQFDVVAMYDIDPEAAQVAKNRYTSLLSTDEEGVEMRERPEVRICGSAEELLSQVEVVDVCTSLRYHPFYCAMALERDIHVMTEKPFARTWWEARHVALLSSQRSALLQLNDDYLFIPRYLRMRNVIESGMIGEVQNLWIVRGNPSSQRALWFWDGLESGGGAIFDYGSHAAASSWFLIGFDKVLAEVRSIRIGIRERTRLVEGRMQTIEVDDDAHFKALYRNPRNGDWTNVVIEATWAQPELGRDGSDVHGYIEVEGSEGSVRTFMDEEGGDCLKVTSRVFGERLIPVKAVHQEEESFQAEFTNFAESIRRGRPSILNAHVGEGVIRLLNSAQLSELRGRKAVTPEDMEAFSAKLAEGARDPWEAGDRIALRLNEPFRLT